MTCRRVAMLLLGSALLGACWLSAPGGPPVRNASSGSDFVLALDMARSHFAANEAIQPYATLTYVGPDPSIAVWGSSSGIVGFGLAGPRGLSMGPGYRDDCKPYPALHHGKALRVPFDKSGGWTEEDPNATFYRDYFSNPVLMLPAGTWRISAETNLQVGPECGGTSVLLRVAVTVVVAQ